MIAVAQLDPATLSLWYSPEIVAQAPEPESMATAVRAALDGDPAAAATAVATLVSDANRPRAVQLVSAVWHEQRHFLDVVLTNHGAFRVRQFVALYANMAALLSSVRAAQIPLTCPLSAYLDPVRRELLGLGEPADAVLKVAADIAARESMAVEDRMVIETPIGRHEVGGDAQLEALGYLFQRSAAEHYFGAAAAYAAERALPKELSMNIQYRWLFILAAQRGLIKVTDLADDVSLFDVSIIPPLLFASLASRHHGQIQTVPGGFSSGFSAGRLFGLLTQFRGAKMDWGSLTGIDAWELMNSTSKILWGRTALEEMEIDLDLEERWCSRLSANEGTLDVVKALAVDLHGLRVKMFAILKHEPALIFDPVEFSEQSLRRLRPAVVVARPAGMLGDPPSPYTRVMGYKEPNSDHPEAKWWWAACQWPDESGDDVLSLRERHAWLSAMDELGPVAKLMMNGRRHRVMLGPEIAMSEARLRSSNIDLKLDPLFSLPSLSEDARSYFYLAAKEEATCDLCRTTVRRDEASLMSPWAFRSHQGAFDLGAEALGGGELGRLRMLRDWSGWLVHVQCQQDFGRRIGLPLEPGVV